jgi:hypothetical protein
MTVEYAHKTEIIGNIGHWFSSRFSDEVTGILSEALLRSSIARSIQHLLQ